MLSVRFCEPNSCEATHSLQSSRTLFIDLSQAMYKALCIVKSFHLQAESQC